MVEAVATLEQQVLQLERGRLEQLKKIEAIAPLEQQVIQLVEDKAEQWRKIDEIRNRLPNWAVMTMSGGGFVIGFLVNWLITCVK
jgi:hypothetical protein